MTKVGWYAVDKSTTLESNKSLKEMGARLTPRKTVVKETLELLEFVGEPGHILGGELKGGNRKLVACCPTRW